MGQPLICMTLTGRTIAEDLELVKKYRKYIDLVELRADFLDDNEKNYIKKFPAKAGLPCILTIRRKIDGGQYIDGAAVNMALRFSDAKAAAVASMPTRTISCFLLSQRATMCQ